MHIRFLRDNNDDNDNNNDARKIENRAVVKVHLRCDKVQGAVIAVSMISVWTGGWGGGVRDAKDFFYPRQNPRVLSPKPHSGASRLRICSRKLGNNHTNKPKQPNQVCL